MKMTPAKNICSFCNRTDVKFYDLKDSIRPPNHLHFKGHTNLRAVLEKILNEKEDGKATNEICQKCREKLHGIYSFTHQHIESEKMLHRITGVTVRLKKLNLFSILTDFKTEFQAISETEDIASLECSSAICDNSAVSGVVVKIECDNNFEDHIDFNNVTKDLNIGLLGGKYSNTADSRSVEQKKIDSMDSDDAEQIPIQDEIIKEEWTMQEGDIFEANANHDVLDREQTKLSYEKCDKPSHAGVKFKCDHCDATYKSKRGLNYHKQSIIGILFNCNQCDAKYKSRDGLELHKMTHAGLTFACNKCDASFSIKERLTRHLRTVHTDAVFSCDHCDATYKSKRGLDYHKQSIIGILFNCNQCDAKYKSREGLELHKMTHAGLTFACNKCDASFSNNRSLSQHLRTVHTKAAFSCDHCDATYKSKHALNLHKESINGILFNCDQCDAKFKTTRSLRHHKITHSGVTFACNQCDARFSTRRYLTRHVGRMHTDTICNHCNVTCKNNQALNEHKQIIHGIYFNCDQCGAKYKTSVGLTLHKGTHTDVTFTCNKCDSSFSNKINLSRHLQRVHTNAVFSCDHCDATYKDKRDLNYHKESISGILFNCDQCDGKFKNRDSLRYHKRTHTGVIFACNKCDASFCNKTNLTQHLRLVHTDEVVSCDRNLRKFEMSQHVSTKPV